MISNIGEKIKTILKNIWSHKWGKYGVFGFIIVVLVISRSVSNKPKVETQIIQSQNIQQTIVASGVVTSSTDLSLSFTGSGMITKMNVAVGDKVKKGQILATLEQSAELGSLLGAKAKLQKIIDGATNEEVAVAKTALDNAQTNVENVKKTQAVLVANAYRALLNTNINAIPASSNISNASPIITGSYVGDKEGVYNITVYSSGSGGYFQASGIENVVGAISYQGPVPFGTKGLFIQFPSGFNVNSSDRWTISLPSINSTSFTTNYNNYVSAVNNQNSQIADAQANYNSKLADYNLKIAKARPADIDLAQADVLSAQAAFEKTIIRAPADGTITKVTFKVGEHVQALQEAIVLQDIDNLYVEGLVNESRVANLLPGLPVTVTYDAIPKDQVFYGTLASIDPGATLDDGVANYKVKVALNEKNPLIRPGMNATFTVTIASKNNVIAIPESALIKKDGGTFVLIAEGKNEHKQVPVSIGMKGDGNLVEVTSGLSVGDSIIISSSK